MSTYLKETVGDRKRIHVVIAEKALGKQLPPKAVVHHFDENPLNNSNSNLVICENQSYHLLLHARQKAMSACGNPDYRKCGICKQWDAQENLNMVNRGDKGVEVYHRRCFRLRATKYRWLPVDPRKQS